LALPQAASPYVRDVGTYFVHRPANLSRSKPVPIVLACCGKLMETSSTLDQQADKSGFVVVYLSPTKTYNDAARMRGPGPPLPDSVWASQVIDEVLVSQNGDRARVYSTGVSSGGTLSYRLACDLPTKIAAIASVAGVDVVLGCQPSRPISVIEIHGTGDSTIPFNGNGKPGSTTIPQVIAKWRAADKCSAASTVSTTAALRDEVWSQCAGNTAVDLAAVINAGHGWPRTIDTGALLWKFLNAHPLVAAGPSAATAKLVSASILYKPTRRVAVRMNLGQASSVRLTLTRGSRTLSSRTVPSANAGVSSYTIRVPRSTKRGTLKLRIVVQASGSQVTVTRSLRLLR
jgi:polyhydroxybutyrate depolymerase